MKLQLMFNICGWHHYQLGEIVIKPKAEIEVFNSKCQKPI